MRKPNVPSPYCPSLFSSPAARCRFNCTGSESHHAIDALKARIAAGTLVLPLGPPVDAVEAELVHAPTDGRHLCHAGRGVKAYGASEIGRRPLCRVDWTVVHGYPLHLCKNTTDRIETQHIVATLPSSFIRLCRFAGLNRTADPHTQDKIAAHNRPQTTMNIEPPCPELAHHNPLPPSDPPTSPMSKNYTPPPSQR